jgi:hypothetical protein
LLWNALEIASIDIFAIHGIATWSLQKHLEFEIYRLDSCLYASDILIEDNLNSKLYDDYNLELKTLG